MLLIVVEDGLNTLCGSDKVEPDAALSSQQVVLKLQLWPGIILEAGNYKQSPSSYHAELLVGEDMIFLDIYNIQMAKCAKKIIKPDKEQKGIGCVCYATG